MHLLPKLLVKEKMKKSNINIVIISFFKSWQIEKMSYTLIEKCLEVKMIYTNLKDTLQNKNIAKKVQECIEYTNKNL